MGKDRDREREDSKKRKKDQKDKNKDSKHNLETPEERKRRKKEKKAKKDKRNEDLCGYTNDTNPFGDSNLTEKFVWKLKREKMAEMGLDPDKFEKEREKKRKGEIKREIEKVKRRREEREIEKQKWEEEKLRLQREKDMLENADWEKKEDEFHLQQAKMRSEIRIKQGRPKPIDILYKNLNMDGDFDFEMDEPYKIFKGLTLQQLEELKNDVRVYLELDSHKEFWQSLLIVCEDELIEARKREEIEKAKGRPDVLRFQEHTGMHSAISDDVASIFKGKTATQLDELQNQITSKMESGAAIDVEYWDTLLKRLKVFRAKAKLKEIHTNLLKKKLADLEEQQLLMREPRREDASSPEPTSPTPSATTATTSAETPSEWDNLEHAQRNRNVEEDEDAGSYSPDLVHSIDGGEEVVDPEDDAAVLAEQRKQVLNIEAKRLRIRASDLGRNPADRVLTEDEMYRMEAEKAMEESEEQFNIEVPLENKVYWWHDKYRPRKPKFFNRVHTGYEWNKYNQTHYDHDNPPPKVVQGYKFNIFYPDLIDKTKAPQYFIQPGPTPDTCTLRIHAGPPYEDIAFRIVNREWEYSHKKGFKCTFERGILHLWFNFKRYRYRR